MDESGNHFPVCPHFNGCSGCSEYLSQSPPPLWEEVLSYFSHFLYSPSPDFHAGSPLHWRHRAKVAVRGSVDTPLLGLFKRHSHDVFPIPNCLVHHPQLNLAFALVDDCIKENKIIPYDEKTGKGELRYLQGVVERTSGRVQLSLVLNRAPTADVTSYRSLILKLMENHPSLWHSLWMNFNNTPLNTIFGPTWIHICGKELLWENFGGTDVCYGPASFGQANLPLFEKMLYRIRELLAPQARLAEFYAGVGAIGLFVASHCRWVRCSEINPHAEPYFQHAHLKLAPEVADRTTFFSGSTHETLSILNEATSLIADPPRKGLDPSIFKALKAVDTVKQFLYISCGWEAFKKDCRILIEEGWKLESIDGYHFFPGSDHVELLVLFER